MRKDNYCIALLSGNIVNLELPQWAVINQTSSASTVTRSYYNKWVEKLLYYAFIDRLHLPNGKLDESFLNRTDVIISQFRMLGYFTVLAAPFVATLVAYVFALENFQRFYSNREHLSERGWTSLSLWQFRDFNELPHTFDRRMKLAYVPAELYVSGHHNRYHSIIGKVICFITGSLITLLLLLSVFDEDILLRVHYRQHNLLWYLGTISVVYAVFRSWTPDYRTRHYHANRLMEQLIGSLHSVPSHWLRLCDTNRVREEVSAIFAYKLKLFFAEIMTILVVPILLLHSIPNSIPHMVDCIRY
jgi:autophagy-related protein 9